MNKPLEHIAFIMDGNRRWAKNKMLPEKIGHKQGVKNMQVVLEALHKFKIKYATFYVFSEENWLRSKDEIENLFDLMREYIKQNTEKFQNDKRFCFKIIGNLSKLPIDLQNNLKELVEKTNFENATNIVLAISYGAQQEILNAVNLAIEKQMKQLSQDDFATLLYTKNIPDPDIIVRTGGHKRLSNFLLWQSAYSEFYFTDQLWPDFDEKSLQLIIDYYNQTIRNYGI